MRRKRGRNRKGLASSAAAAKRHFVKTGAQFSVASSETSRVDTLSGCSAFQQAVAQTDAMMMVSWDLSARVAQPLLSPMIAPVGRKLSGDSWLSGCRSNNRGWQRDQRFSRRIKGQSSSRVHYRPAGQNLAEAGTKERSGSWEGDYF